MAQIFHPISNPIAKASVVAAALIVGGLGYIIYAVNQSAYYTGINEARQQPVPFSHKHHVTDDGIDCRYCHTTVEKSPYPGMPATETCMSCHSQIWTNSPLLEPLRESYETGTPLHWTQVNKLPEFVFFRHDIHISRGINCNTCHGPVEEMQITYKGNSFEMSWCLQCHRAPWRYLYQDKSQPDRTPRQQVFDLYWKIQAGEPLSAREKDLAQGNDPASDKPEDVAEGKKLAQERGIRVAELADCWICHR